MKLSDLRDEYDARDAERCPTWWFVLDCAFLVVLAGVFAMFIKGGLR